MKKTFISTPPVQKKLSERKAFALVLSLALMGFMVLLIVTLATMVQMQMRLSRQSMNDFKAKQAAKFAAYQAMSRVQSALGPDQRITANAMMFDDTVASPITELDNDKKFEWWSAPMNIDRDEAEKIDDARDFAKPLLGRRVGLAQGLLARKAAPPAGAVGLCYKHGRTRAHMACDRAIKSGKRKAPTIPW